MRKGLALVSVIIALVNTPGAPAASIKGNVTDSLTGAALSGVSISIKGTANKTTTDAQGKFALSINTNTAINRGAEANRVEDWHTNAKSTVKIFSHSGKTMGAFHVFTSFRWPRLADGIYVVEVEQNGTKRISAIPRIAAGIMTGKWVLSSGMSENTVPSSLFAAKKAAARAAVIDTLVLSKSGYNGKQQTAIEGDTAVAVKMTPVNAPDSGWPNIRVVGNHLCDRYGKPFAVRSIESMFGNGTSNAIAFAAGHKSLGANTMGPLPNSGVMGSSDIDKLLAAAYNEGLIIGLNADHTGKGESFFKQQAIQVIINRYPNVFLQEAIELGSGMTEDGWVAAAKKKVDVYVDMYPDKPLKIGSPSGGRSPRFALDRCKDVVDYYYSKGGRGGLIFTCQLYWKAATSSWSYQEENGFPDGLPGILKAIDAMAASPCMFMPGLDNNDDVGYTGWREVMDHVRASNVDPGQRLSYQWWVYYNSGDEYSNDLTTNAVSALSGITSVGKEVKAKLEADREYVVLGPMNP
jgi:hypothetical protein